MSEVLKRFQNIPKEKRILFFILFLGAFLRLIKIGNIPGNTELYVDELLCGYESWSILNYGFDYMGYPFPVYLPSWGTGMNALQAYIQMPFIKLFGLNSFSVRLPAAILGCITLYAFYYICKKVKGTDFALFSTFILCIMPWHIIQSRWSIECNFFSGFITISIALLIKACENKKFLPLAFVFIGLSLYAYALPWTIMPLFVISITVYLLYRKGICFDRYLILSYGILFVIALPLILFVLVNMNVIPEIITPFMSMPKLLHFRSDEIITSPKDLLKNFYQTLKCFITQDDGYTQSAVPVFGLYFKFSNPFILIGMAHTLVDFWNNRKKEVQYVVMVLILFACSIIVGSTIEISFYRMNMIHIPITLFLCDGLWCVINFIQRDAKNIVLAIYAISCICFLTYYVTYHDEKMADLYDEGSRYALEYIHEQESLGVLSETDPIVIYSGMHFTKILFYEQYPTDKYLNEVVYEDTELTGVRIHPRYFGRYRFIIQRDLSSAPSPENIYICSTKDTEITDYLEQNGFDLNYFSKIVVAIKK